MDENDVGAALVVGEGGARRGVNCKVRGLGFEVSGLGP